MNNIFPLAPMCSGIRVLTIILLLLPLFFGLYTLFYPEPTLTFVTSFLIILYILVWFFCRPTYFAISPHYFKVQFPAWYRSIPMSDISGIRLINVKTFTQEFGSAMRIGVGGLWGGFGWLWTTKKGFLEFYISTNENLILIERLRGNYLLLTPSNALEMMDLIQSFLIGNNNHRNSI